MLAWTIYLSFAGALAVALVPERRPQLARVLALLVAVAGLILAGVGYFTTIGAGAIAVADAAWIPQMGIRFQLTADGISRMLVLLTGLASVSGVLFSWRISNRANHFFGFYLALIGGVYGVFLASDLFLFFVFYEIAIVPKYFLIAIWGSTRREYAAMKLALYSFVGSAMVLIGALAVYASTGAHSTVLADLATAHLPVATQMWLFPLVFAGFAILAGMWPFHTWAPTGHVAAPTAASMLLAGVVMKLGAYGCLRIAMGLFPRGLDPWGFSIFGLDSWRAVFALLAIIGILYGALVALVQNDFKFVIGYSSVSHMGFVLLGLMSLNLLGVDGAVLQMFSHGIIAGLLFAIVGCIVYERTHTRQLEELELMRLGRKLPFAAWAFVLAGSASMGLPGFSGFVAELQVLAGSWAAMHWWTYAAGVGLVIGVAYTWRALQKAFFAETPAGIHANEKPHKYDPIGWHEWAGVSLLAVASLVVGLYPRILLDTVDPAVRALLLTIGGAR